MKGLLPANFAQCFLEPFDFSFKNWFWGSLGPIGTHDPWGPRGPGEAAGVPGAPAKPLGSHGALAKPLGPHGAPAKPLGPTGPPAKPPAARPEETKKKFNERSELNFF